MRVRSARQPQGPGAPSRGVLFPKCQRGRQWGGSPGFWGAPPNHSSHIAGKTPGVPHSVLAAVPGLVQ